MAKRKLSVFLAHAPGDVAAARTLYGQLTGEGWLDVWLEEARLSPGADTHLEIEKAISKAHLAILCISKNATSESGIFQKQLRLILEAEQNMPEGTIFVIPLKLEECEPPFLLRRWRFANYFGEERESVYQSVLRGLRARAKELKINMEVNASPPNGETAPAAQNQSAPSITIGGDATKNIILGGNNNQLTIHYHNAPDEPAGDESQ